MLEDFCAPRWSLPLTLCLGACSGSRPRVYLCETRGAMHIIPHWQVFLFRWENSYGSVLSLYSLLLLSKGAFHIPLYSLLQSACFTRIRWKSWEQVLQPLSNKSCGPDMYRLIFCLRFWVLWGRIKSRQSAYWAKESLCVRGWRMQPHKVIVACNLLTGWCAGNWIKREWHPSLAACRIRRVLSQFLKCIKCT